MRSACNDGRALALTAVRRERPQSRRGLPAPAGLLGQDTCVSTPNAITASPATRWCNYAYTGVEPTEWQWPSDRSDYAACVRAVRKMPRHRQNAGSDGKCLGRRKGSLFEAGPMEAIL